MRGFRISVAVVLSILIIAVCVPAWAQENRPAAIKKLLLKSIKFPSQIKTMLTIQEFFPTSQRKGLALADGRMSDDQLHVFILQVNGNGKAKLVDTFPVALENGAHMSALLVDGTEADGSPAAEKSRGLLFCGHDQEKYEWAAVSMARFNGKGKFIGEPVELIHITKPAGVDEILVDRVFAAKGPNSVAVAVSLRTYTWEGNKITSMARFFETDFDGNLIGGIREVPFDPSKNLSATLYRPVWSGKRWLVPLRLTEREPKITRTCSMIIADSAAAAVPANGTSISIEEVYRLDSSETIIFSLNFLPEYQAAGETSARPAASKRFKLVIDLLTGIPRNTTVLTKSNNEFLIQQIKDTGAKIRKPRPLKVKPWSRILAVEEGMMFETIYEMFSDYHAVAADSYISARAVHIRRVPVASAPAATKLDEGRLSLFSFDKKLKKISEVAAVDFKTGGYPRDWPLLRDCGGKYWIIIKATDPQSNYTAFYVSTFVL
ncbi:MAG TPA: hypothetical protein VMX35_03055 [Acidobacteriota bacterium]|nr:hypothetical protein [Acidobacteriota bacterium]